VDPPSLFFFGFVVPVRGWTVVGLRRFGSGVSLHGIERGAGF